LNKKKTARRGSPAEPFVWLGDLAVLRMRPDVGTVRIASTPSDADVFLEAAGLYRAARRAGLTVRSGVDCLIAACALRHDATVLHQDRDFDALARVSPLKAQSVTLTARH